MQSQTHHLKIQDKYLEDIKCGIKTFEVRQNDRDFKVGDQLLLKCTSTGETLLVNITYILHGGRFGIDPNYVILGIEHIYPKIKKNVVYSCGKTHYVIQESKEASSENPGATLIELSHITEVFPIEKTNDQLADRADLQNIKNGRF